MSEDFFGKVKVRSGMNDGGHPAANTEVSRGLLGARNARKCWMARLTNAVCEWFQGSIPPGVRGV